MKHNRRQPTHGGGRRGRSNGDKNKKIAIGIVAILAIVGIIVWINWPKPHYLPIEGQVREVRNDGMLTLNNGLTVELLGITPNTKTIEFLRENLIGKQVRVTADSKDTKPYYYKASTDKVKGYVTVLGNVSYSNLNGYMLQNGLADLNTGYCQDSLEAFRAKINPSPAPSPDGKPAPDDGKILTKTELAKKMLPATFLIVSSDGEGGTGIGTGFFINENGLALTNYHVFAAARMAKIYLCDEKGNITEEQNRNISRVVSYSRDNDWCIFIVDLDPGEKSTYLSLSKKDVERGNDVALVGNPRGLTATFTTGEISNIHKDEAKIQIDASMYPGNSGGPICTYDGKVVGIAQSVAGDASGNIATGNMNFGVDIQVVRKALDKSKDSSTKSYGGK